jgi:hypothetical protein
MPHLVTSEKVAAIPYLARQQGLGDPTKHSLDSRGVTYDRSSNSETARKPRFQSSDCVGSGSKLRARRAAQRTPLRQQAAAALVGLFWTKLGAFALAMLPNRSS